MSYHDVTVLGAGWAGLVATKHMLEEGLTVVALEKRDNLGGLWYYSDDPSEKTTMKSTRMTSSTTVTELSDYPMPEEMGEFPHHEKVLQYLQSYSKHFGLDDHIHFDTTVEKVEKKGNLWNIAVSTGKVYTSKHLVVATGAPLPRDPHDSLFQGFTGSIYHSKEIKEPIEKHHGCKLLVIGGGETSADVCADWYDHTSVIHWSAPGGQHFFRRFAKVLPWKNPQALDKASSRLLTSIAPYHKSKPGLQWICKWTTNGSLLAYQGHGIPEWRNDTPFMHRVINKNGHILDLVDYKKIVPKGAIQSCNGRRVTFADGSSEEFDLVILCTGYLPSFSFLPETYKPTSFRHLYKHIFNVEDPTLSFTGYIRPVIGSVAIITEAQARLIAKVYNGTIKLGSKSTRLSVTEADANFWYKYFKTTSQRLDNLVEGYLYVDEIAKLAQIYPNFPLLMNQNIYHLYVALVAPFTCAQFRLNDPKKRDQAIATMERRRQGTTHPAHLLLILFLRLIWFDWLLSQLGYIKYKIQTSSGWAMVRYLPPVRFVNWIWCLPKKFLFDNSSRIEPPQ